MAVKMDKTTIIVVAVVGSLGVLSAVLGFAAEGGKLKYGLYLYSYYYSGQCYYKPNPALGLGVCAVIFLIIAQVIFAVVGGCCGCCNSRALPTGTKQTIGVVCAVASWITAVIAFALFVAGASASGQGYRDVSAFGVCDDVPASGIFAGGGVLALAATVLGLISYVLLRGQPAVAAVAAAAPNMGEEQVPAGAVGIAVGKPQIQQTPQPYVGGGEQQPAAAPGKPQLQQPQKPPQAPPRKYPKFTLRPQGSSNVELVYQQELQVEGSSQAGYQNDIGAVEGEAQAYGGEYNNDAAPTMSNLPGEEPQDDGGDHFDCADIEF